MIPTRIAYWPTAGRCRGNAGRDLRPRRPRTSSPMRRQINMMKEHRRAVSDGPEWSGPSMACRCKPEPTVRLSRGGHGDGAAGEIMVCRAPSTSAIAQKNQRDSTPVN